MKTVVLLFVFATAAYASVVPLDNDVPTKEYQRFVEVPGDDNQMHKVDLEEPSDLELLEEVSRDPAYNKYLLYTRRNRDVGRELVFLDASTIWRSGYEAWKPTVVIAHGWLGNQNSDLNPVLVEAFLDNADANVIVLDWSHLARSGYVTAATGVPAVGSSLGQFLEWLHQKTGAPYNKFHLVGFSLGAHLVGNAGRYLNGEVARITGLDPAGPLWQLNLRRLRASNAVYVEAIHTDGEYLGIGSDVGNVDFYVNGGESQPGCLTSICYHNRAWEVFASTVRNNHLVGKRCLTNIQMSLNRCSGQELNLGNADLKKTGSGRFRVNTRRRYPF